MPMIAEILDRLIRLTERWWDAETSGRTDEPGRRAARRSWLLRGVGSSPGPRPADRSSSHLEAPSGAMSGRARPDTPPSMNGSSQATSRPEPPWRR